MAMSDINRFSHVVMSDSPVSAPFGIRSIKALALKLFGSELEITRRVSLEPGRALALLPKAELPEDMQWAKPNQRVADAVARYAAAVEREGAREISAETRRVIRASIARWNGETMSLDGRWINEDIASLTGEDRAIARLAVVIAKASYRVTEAMVKDVLGADKDEERFIRILAWSSSVAARRFAEITFRKIEAGDCHTTTLAA